MRWEVKPGEGNGLVYDFYVDLIRYVVLPESMQTVSLVERIFDDLWKLYLTNWPLCPLLDSDYESFSMIYCRAGDFVRLAYPGSDFGAFPDFDFICSFGGFGYSDVHAYLRDNARSESVKNYFGL